MPFTPNPDLVFADGPAGSPIEPYKPDIRKIWKQAEQAIDAYSSGAGSIAKQTQEQLNGDLLHDADVTAWVYDDGDNSGIYRKAGASGSGSWSIILPLPFSFIIASDVGAGTPNAIQATTSVPVFSSALVWMSVYEDNTNSPVTIRFNNGPTLTIKTNSGDDVEIGGLQAGSILLGIVSGSTFRLFSDQAIANRLLQAREDAEQAAAEAGADADRAESARDQAAGYVNDIVSEKEVPITGTRDGMEAIQFPPGMNSIQTRGLSTMGDGGDAQYIRVTSEPAHDRKVRSEDRYLPNETIDAGNGGWWEKKGPKPIVVLATGQSNLVNYRSYSWSPSVLLKQWDNANNDETSVGTAFAGPAGDVINPSLSFCQELSRSNPGVDIYLVNIGRSGQAISQWLPGASSPDVYAAIAANVPPALVAAGADKIDILLWWQGETGGQDQTYVADFETVQDRFKTESWFEVETPVVVFGIINSVDRGSVSSRETNVMLQLCVNAQPSSRKFVNTGFLQGATYWLDTLHGTAECYLIAGIMAASSYHGKVAGNSAPGIAVDYETGSILVGASFSQSKLHVSRNARKNTPQSSATMHAVDADGTAASFVLDSYGASAGGQFIGRANRGTAESPTAVQANDILASFEGRGRHTAGTAASGASSTGMARLFARASENWTSTAMGASLEAYVTPNGTITPILAYTILHDGRIYFEKAITWKPPASITPGSNGQATFELTSNTSLTVKVKGSDGVVRSAVLTLS